MADAIVLNPPLAFVMNNDKAAGQQADREYKELFDDTFREHYRNMYAYAFSILKDQETAEEVVQLIFCKLWEKREQIQVQKSLKSYLYRMVHNESLNYLRGAKVREKYEKKAMEMLPANGRPHDSAGYKELQQRISHVLNELPEQCRTIFQLSRYEELPYRDIAEQMNVPLSTVKNEVAKALKLLRVRLADYLPVLLSLLLIEKL